MNIQDYSMRWNKSQKRDKNKGTFFLIRQKTIGNINQMKYVKSMKGSWKIYKRINITINKNLKKANFLEKNYPINSKIYRKNIKEKQAPVREAHPHNVL